MTIMATILIKKDRKNIYWDFFLIFSYGYIAKTNKYFYDASKH